MKTQETAIKPTRTENYPEWYQQVVKASELAEISDVRGCMVIRPWGYGIWERMKEELDRRFKETGHENAYFPLFIPLSYLQKEAEHVEGFAKECAVVTHHRLKLVNGKLIPDAPLEEPLIVRPTSETIIGESFSRWVKSYRDLPLLINQWANVVRWEMRTRVFLRTSEFLWQEGHTAHATEAEAIEEVQKMLEVYHEFCRNVIAMPTIKGEKPAHERFPGAERSLCIEAMMQDRKSLQAGTSHYLGQNFAKASNIKFLAENGSEQYAYTTSWGVSTRMIGGLIMTHSDDNGLRLPPMLAAKQIVIIPLMLKDADVAGINEYCAKLQKAISAHSYGGRPIQVHFDTRDLKGSDKGWQWIKKGVPLRIEVGPKDFAAGQITVYRRDGENVKDRLTFKVEEFPAQAAKLLAEIQENMLEQAEKYQKEYTYKATSFDDLKSIFKSSGSEDREITGGFVRAYWAEDPESLKMLDDLKLYVTCIPADQPGVEGKCILTGKPAKTEFIFARKY